MQNFCDWCNSGGMKPQEPHKLPLFEEENSSKNDEINLAGVNLIHRFMPYGQATVWLVDYNNEKDDELSIAQGSYTLITVPETANGSISCATRMCTLPEHPALATVEALSQFGNRNHVWVQPIVCTLEDLLQETQKLSPEQTVWCAEQIAEGLENLHLHGMGYEELIAQNCAFTSDLRAVLLPPQVDTRGFKEQKIREQVSEDIKSFAQLLWLCLLGENPPAQRNRLPLNAVLPVISSTTAQLFEKALDQASDAPSPVELALALRQDVDPEVPPLHLAAPSVTRGSIKPLESAPTRETSEKISSKRKPPLSLPPKKTSRRTRNHPNTQKKKRTALLVVAPAVAFAAGGLLFTAWPQNQATETSAVAEESPPQDLQESAQNEKDAEENAVVEMVQKALDLRNQALASGKADTIVGYAAVGSDAELSDQQIVESNAGNPLEAQLVLDQVHDFSLKNDVYTVTVTVKSDRPIDALESDESIYIQDGVPHQKVKMVFQRTQDDWLLMQATPQPNKNSPS